MARRCAKKFLFSRARQGENQHPKPSPVTMPSGRFHRGSALRRQRLTTANRRPEAELCGLAGVPYGRFSLGGSQRGHWFNPRMFRFAQRARQQPLSEARLHWGKCSYWPSVARQGNPADDSNPHDPDAAVVPMAKAASVQPRHLDEIETRCSGDRVYGKGGIGKSTTSSNLSAFRSSASALLRRSAVTAQATTAPSPSPRRWCPR